MISKVVIQNVLGISAAVIDPSEPVVLVCGPNGAGKTSVYQAIKLALLDELPRVDLKRDAIEIVRSGAQRGSVAVTLDGASFAVALPSRTRNEDSVVFPSDTQIRLCLNPHRFAAMEPKERMQYVRNLAGVAMNPAAIQSRMAAHWVPEPIIAAIAPILILGFEKCVVHAKEQAAESRGAWKQITGETYGSKKAETWTPPPAGEIPQAPMPMAEAVQKHASAAADRQKLNTLRATYDDRAIRKGQDEALAAQVEGLKGRIALLEPTATADEERAHLACPECGSLLDLEHTDLASSAKLIPAKPSSLKGLAKGTIAKAKAEIDSLRRQLRAADAAVARLAEPLPAEHNPTDPEIAAAEEQVNLAADVMRSLAEQNTAYAKAVQAQQDAEKRRQSALLAHERVHGWEIAAEALAPSGIPSELMAQAMAPMRAAIKAACASESVRDWPLPELADDGTITAWGGRPYHLLSESEQYRVDLILTAALAGCTGTKLLAADRADVLSPKVRGECVAWLLDLIDDGVLQQVWLFATLKQAPQGGDGVEVFWVDNGVLLPQRIERAAA